MFKVVLYLRTQFVLSIPTKGRFSESPSNQFGRRCPTPVSGFREISRFSTAQIENKNKRQTSRSACAMTTSTRSRLRVRPMNGRGGALISRDHDFDTLDGHRVLSSLTDARTRCPKGQSWPRKGPATLFLWLRPLYLCQNTAKCVVSSKHAWPCFRPLMT